MFQAMRDSGAVAEMGPHAFTVYSIIKSYVTPDDPVAFPSIDQICTDVGFSKSSVIRSIHKLIEMGYLVKEMQGRNASYKIRERIPIVDDSGELQTTATWEYIPKYTVDTVNELKELLKGNQSGSEMKYVHIEHLQVVISNLEQGASQQIVNGDFVNNTGVPTHRVHFDDEE